MGWKNFTILVQPAEQINYTELLSKLGFAQLEQQPDEPYEIALYPRNNKVYIGHYKNSLLICDSILAEHFLSSEISDTEKVLINLFPQAEIAAFVLHSGANYWGYAVIKNGIKIRSRSGDGGNGTTLDFGEPLPEELSLLAQSYLDEDNNRLYKLNEQPTKSFTEDQVGENFVFELYRRYTGIPLDEDEDLLFESSLKCYQVIKRQYIDVLEASKKIKNHNKAKPWWKFW